MQIIYKDDMFKIQQYLTPVGKIVNGRIVSLKTLNTIKNYIEDDIENGRKFQMLSQKINETSESEREQYIKEAVKLLKRKDNKKLKPKNYDIKVRVIGYDDNNNTIVEPVDKRNKTLIIKLGYPITH